MTIKSLQLNRRRFMAGCASCVALMQVAPAIAEEITGSEEVVPCSAIDSAYDDDEGDEYDPYGVGEDPNPTADEKDDEVERDFEITPYGTMFKKLRWRRHHGLTPNTGVITLGVCFLNGTSQQHAIVKSIAVEWLSDGVEKYLQFQFGVEAKRSQIRVRFSPNEGNNSRVGIRALKVAKTRPTMRLQQTTKRAILHEFGHALGLDHEHMHPDIPIRWNREVVIDYFKRTQGWSKEFTERNILARYSAEAACVGDPKPNRDSIMMYEIRPDWTYQTFSARLTNTISKRDRDCLVGAYSER